MNESRTPAQIVEDYELLQQQEANAAAASKYVGAKEVIEKPNFLKKGLLIIGGIGILLIGGFFTFSMLKNSFIPTDTTEKKVEMTNSSGRKDLGLPTAIPAKPILPTEIKSPEASAKPIESIKPFRQSMLLTQKKTEVIAPAESNTAANSGATNSGATPPALARINPYLNESGGMQSPEKAMETQKKMVDDLMRQFGVTGGGTGQSKSSTVDVSKELATISSGGVQSSANKARKNDDQDYTLNASSFIPCILQNEIISTSPGDSVCLVSKDVYSSNGKNIVILQNSKLMGSYSSEANRGVDRIVNSFDRLNTADGFTLNINAYATGNSGASGIAAEVNNKWPERIGGALLLAIFQDGASFGSQQLAYNQYLREEWRKEDVANAKYEASLANVRSTTRTITTTDEKTGISTSTTTTDAPRSSNGTSNYYGSTSSTSVSPPVWGTDASRATMRSIADKLMEQQAGIKPVMRVKKGTEILVYVKNNLNFSDVYKNTLESTSVKTVKR
jgi:type IV secretory pathway VirB10-like protein